MKNKMTEENIVEYELIENQIRFEKKKKKKKNERELIKYELT